MFTIEFEPDSVVIKSLDDNDKYEDIEMIVGEDGVFIRQWQEETGKYELVCISYGQWMDLVHAMTLPEGAYYNPIYRKDGRIELERRTTTQDLREGKP